MAAAAFRRTGRGKVSSSGHLTLLGVYVLMMMAELDKELWTHRHAKPTGGHADRLCRKVTLSCGRVVWFGGV